MAKPSSGLRVAVTGAAGSLGRRLVARLLDDSGVERVVALDREPLKEAHPELGFRTGDVRDVKFSLFALSWLDPQLAAPPP